MSEPRDPKSEAGEAKSKDDRHPLSKAAWDGYRQYREEMDQRGFLGSMHKLGFKDVLLLGVIMAGIFGLLVLLDPA